MSSLPRPVSLQVRHLLPALLLAAAACREPAPQRTASEPPALIQGRQGLRSPLDNVGDVFLGQTAANLNSVNLLDGRGLNAPEGLALDTSVSPPRVYVADTANSRVLAWADARAFANGAPADRVIGQPDAFRNACNTTAVGAASLCTPRAVEVDAAGNLYVADTGNHRVLGFNTPFSGDLIADRVFGQGGSFFTTTCNLSGSPSATTLCTPMGLAVDGAGDLYVSDQGNHRVLRYASPLSDQVADGVLGQGNLTYDAPNRVDERGLTNPTRLVIDRSVTPNRIYVADTDNHRVLGWSSAAGFASGAPADKVIGQPDFATSGCNTGGVGAGTLCYPRGVVVDAAGNLYVADTNNNRVLVFDTPFTSDAVADKVWGQTVFTGVTCNSGGIGAGTLCGPWGVALDATGRLLVADSGNHRVLLFAGGRTGDGLADVVMGQTDFTARTCNAAGISAQSLCNPRGLTFDASGNLYVADYGNSRVLEYNASPVDVVADRAFGQASMTSGSCNAGGLSGSSLCNPGSVAVDGAGNVWVGDEGNSRVLGYLTPLTTNLVADKVVGKSSVTSTGCSTASVPCLATTAPAVAVDDANNLYVADPSAHRVLAYNAPFATGGNTTADRVLGQTDFENTGRNSIDAAGLSGPTGVHVDRSSSPNRLYVADSANSRVLAWSLVGLTSGQAADRVLGQAVFTTGLCNKGGPGPSGLCSPIDMATDAAGNVYVSDNNSRVLEYDAPFGTSGDAVADRVFGQKDFTAISCNSGGISALSICNPRALGVAPSGEVFVVDSGNHRVLRYDAPLSTDLSADAVLGQGSFRYNGSNLVDGAGLSSPYAVALDTSVSPARLYVADNANSRVLGWADVTSFQNGSPADLVLGQPDLLTSGCNSQGVSASSLCGPTGVTVDSRGRVYVADSSNDRVLLYEPPFTTDTVADKVMGQADFTGTSCNRGQGSPSASTLCDPHGVAVGPAFELFIGDLNNDRVLAYVDPWSTDITADFVFGQAGFITSGCNRGGRSASSLCDPYYLALDTSVPDLRLYVADSANNRVLEYDAPLTSDRVADLLIGQTVMTTDECETSLTELCDPKGVAVDSSGNVYVGDNDNDRVLQFNSPRTTDVSADRLFGQASATGSSCNTGGLSASSLCGLRGVALDAVGSLYVADSSNHRVVIYLANNRPTAASLTLTPSAPKTDEDLTGTYSFKDVDGDVDNGSEIRWFRDGEEQVAFRGTLTVPASATTRGEQWYFTVRPRDGVESGRLEVSPKVTIANTLPVAATATISPVPPRTEDVLSVQYAFTDADGDVESGSEIRWLLDNEEQPELRNQRTVPASATVRGQLWSYIVRPSDGTTLGAPVSSLVVTIANTAPSASNVQISPSSPSSASSLSVSYTFVDPDGDGDLGSEIRWFRNGQPEPGLDNQRTVPGPLTLNEQWYYMLRPRDGSSLGAWVTSTTVVVGSSAPTATDVRITPNPLRTEEPLTASYTYSDPDKQSEANSQLRWFKNDLPQTAYNNLKTVPASATTKGDRWSFTVTPCDPTPLCGPTQTAPVVTVANTAPVATAPTITPPAPKSTDALTASYGYADADGDVQSGSEIRWFKNGVEQTALANLSRVPAGSAARGQNWYYILRPKDGVDFGAPVTSDTVVIANTPPTAGQVAISPSSPRVTDTLTASYRYSDADNDPEMNPGVKWFRNDVEDSSLKNLRTVPPSKLVKGQAWKFTLTPEDSTSSGTSVTSAVVTILNSAPAAANLAISPTNPNAGEALTAVYAYSDADGDAQANSEIRWFKNGVEQTALFNKSTVPLGSTAKGQKWSFSVRPKDGTDFGTPLTSAEVSIANNAPLASSLAIQPAQPGTDDNLVASYSYADTDGDLESGTEYHWFKNGTEAPAYRGLKTLPASATAKGESWYVTVKPRDGTDFGPLVTSTPVVILNSPPRATNVNLSPLSPKATDPLVGSYTYADSDVDAQQGTELRWYRNDVEVTELAGQLTVPAGTAKAGETWYFTVKPKDGVAFGPLVTSTSVIVGSSAPVATALQITPFAPSGQDALVANYLYSDPDGEPESGSEYNWYRNGTLVASLAGLKTVPAGTARKGEAWSFSVRPRDGASFGAMQTSPTVTLGNTVPSASNATLNPAQPRTEDALQAVYTYVDLDGDVQSGSELRWYRNGLEQPSLFNQTVVPASATTKREVWYYRVRPRDGSDHGIAEVSSPVFIENSPPVASAGPDQTIPPTQAVMRVTLDGVGSRDADGDVLDYAWSEGGTVLGRGSRVSVDLPIGKHTLVLTVGDGEATTTDEVIIDIPAPKPTATAPADFTASPGRVVLAGSGSDPLGRTLEYRWTQVSGEPVELQDAGRATAWFLGLRAGTRTFELVATAGASSEPVRTTVTLRDVAPWASVPARRVVAVGEEVALDGSGSADPNSDALTWRWTPGLGAATSTLLDADQPVARLTPQSDGRYAVTLVVNDETQDSTPALAEVIAIDPRVTSHVPVANAGPDGVGESGQSIVLEGRGSYDVDGDALTYTWRKISGPADPPTPATSATPTLRATGAGKVVLGLTVSDGKTTSAEDTVTLEINDPAANRRPIARAGSDRTAVVGAELHLDATRSADPDGDVLTYQWTQLAGPQVTFDDAGSAKPTFTPTRPGFIRLGLTVSDGKLTSVPSTVLVQVTTGSNRPPLASAGADQQVVIGNVATLDGSGSSDPDGQALRYVWEQVWGSPMVLTGSDMAPRFSPPGKGRYRFRLTVWDGEVPSAPDEVDVVVSTHGADNKTPRAVVGAAVEVDVGEKVVLEGTGSQDPDPLDRLSFEWTLAGFPTGNEPVLADAATATPSFTPAVPGVYTLRLRVSDGDLTSAPAYVTVTARSDSKGGPLGCSSGTGAPLPLAALLALLGWRRRGRVGRASGSPWARALAVFLALGVASMPGLADASPRKVVRGKSKSAKPSSKSALKLPKKGKGKRLPKGAVAAPPVEESPTEETVSPLPSEDEAAVTPETSAAPSAQEPAPSEGPRNSYLEEARQLYLSFQFEEILPKLEFALAVKGVTTAQRMEIYKLMALTHSAFDDAVKAEEAFLHILELKPDYELTGGASPKIRSYFANAQKAYRARQAVRLRHAPPKPNAHGGTTTVDVAVTAGVDRVSAMTLHYRPRGSTGGFSQIGMVRGEDGAFSGNVPNAFPGPAGKRTIEYFIRARDESGALLSSVGGEQAPLELTMETVALTVSEPLYKNWLFWTAVGVGAAAAVAVPVVVSRDAPVRPGTIGLETLK